MSLYNSLSMNDVKPILLKKEDGEFELPTMMVRNSGMVSGEEIEYVTVTAPTNLPAGYELIVDVMDGSFWTVQVPDGGVTMNETMRAKVLHKSLVAKAELVSTQPSTSLSSKNMDPLMKKQKNFQFDIPTGRWRDGILDCCIIPNHPLFFATYCFPLITLGQVMTRIKFQICNGNGRNTGLCPRAFYVMLTITIVNLFIQVFFSGMIQTVTMAGKFMFSMTNGFNAANPYNNPYAFPSSSSNDGGMTFNDDAFFSLFNGTTTFNDDAFNQMMINQAETTSAATTGSNVAVIPGLGMGIFHFLYAMGFFIFILVVHTKTRNRIRRAYSIGNDKSCFGDCCCAFWCGMCSICQMSRHTANYHNTHRARCCTPTGLDEEWDDYDFINVSQNDLDLSQSTMPMVV